MTLTLLLQLTDEEQLYAQAAPAVQPVVKEAVAPAAPAELALVLQWPGEEGQANG
ncbi:MAG: hypothetical protein QM724_10520 [Flavobacteriales bacterium]